MITSVVQTPRLKSEEQKAEQELAVVKLTVEPKFRKRSSSIGGKERHNPDNYENQFKEQFIIMRMESITTEKRKYISEQNFGMLRKASLLGGLKESSFNEFSFKNSVDSSQVLEKLSNSVASSRQNFEASASNISNETSKRNPNDTGMSFGPEMGLRRSFTPTFTNRLSGLLVEKKNSMRNLHSKSNSTFNTHQPLNFSNSHILPHDLKFDRSLMDLTSPLFNPSLDDGGLGALRNELEIRSVSSKETVGFPSTLNKIDEQTLKKLGMDNLSFLEENWAQPEEYSPSRSHQIHQQRRVSIETVNEQSCEHDKIGSTTLKDEDAELNGVKEDTRLKRKRSSCFFDLAGRKIDYTNQTSPITILEPLTIKLSELSQSIPSIGKISETKRHGGSTPTRARSHSKNNIDNSLNESLPGYSKLATVKTPKTESTSTLKSGRSCSASKIIIRSREEFSSPGSYKQTQNRFSPLTKLTVREKFKVNLLDAIRNEDNSMSASSTQQRRPIKPIHMSSQALNRTVRVDPSKSGSNNAAGTSFNQSVDNQRAKASPPREKAALLVVSSGGSLGTNHDVQHQKPDSVNKDVRSSPLKKASDKLKTDLLSLVRAQNIQPESPVKVTLPKLARMNSIDNFGGHGPSPSPISKSNHAEHAKFRLLDLDSAGLSPNAAASTGTYNNFNAISSYQNIQNQSYVSVTPHNMNETYNRSIFNLDDNVSAMNVSNYIFSYENEEIEYEEVNGVNIHALRNQDQKILSELGSSPSNRSPAYSPLNRSSFSPMSKSTHSPINRSPGSGPLKRHLSIGRESPTRNFAIRKSTMSPNMRKDLHYSNATSALIQTKKESFASFSSIHGYGQQNVESPDYSYQEGSTPKVNIMIQNHQISEELSEEKEDEAESFRSPVNKLKKTGSTVELNKYRPVRTSLFHQESEGSQDMAFSPQGVGSIKADVKTPEKSEEIQSSKNVQNSVDSVLSSLVEDEKEENQTQAKNLTPIKILSSPNDSQETIKSANEDEVAKPNNQIYGRRSSEIPAPRSPIMRSPLLQRTKTTVVETNKLDKTRDDDGQKKINHYLLVKDLGK